MISCQIAMSPRFVTGNLNPEDEASFVEHLESCADCRAALEVAAGDQSTWDSAKHLLAFSNNRDSAEARADIATDDQAALRQSLTFLAPTDDPRAIGRVGPYDILGVLGRGGMGIVLKGFDRPLNRNVAIKVLDPAAAAVGAARERFAREARAMAAISHEHVVPVYAVDVHAGLPYFVMEYVAGGSLEAGLRSRGPFDAVSVVRVGLQVAQSLAAAHRQGLVHRDIKPGNILIDSGTERVRVADFGLARVASDITCTRSGVISGTPHYMAPEQVRGESCDAQSDLFSLGGVMYSLCTGHPPFRAESVYGVMQRVLQDDPRSIVEQNPATPPWLEAFVMRLLAKEKSNRFRDASEVVDILTAELAYLQNPSVAAKPERPWALLSNRRSRESKLWKSVLMTSAATVAIAVAAIFMQQSPPDAGRTDQRSAGSSVDSTTQTVSSTVPLWAADGTTRAQLQADVMETSLLGVDNRSGLAFGQDSWAADVARVRRTLSELTSKREWRSQ